MATSADGELPDAPPPWHCKCKTYILFINTLSSSPPPHEKIFSPLEASSAVWTDEKVSGKFRGGLGAAWIVRYSETPVGPYDELVIQPGNYEAPDALDCKGKFMRVTGTWVSQEATCMNGRKTWNIPKHLARFKFTQTTSAPLPLKVEVTEMSAEKPFFSTTIHPTTWTPSFPFNSKWMGYLGLPTKVLQPPLPTGKPPHVEVGTDKWALIAPELKSKTARLIWLDMEQDQEGETAAKGNGEAHSSSQSSADHWWPGFGRWRLGMSCEDGTLDLGPPEKHFDAIQE